MISTTTKEAANFTKDSAMNDVKNTVNSTKRDVRDAAGNVIDDLAVHANQAGKKLRDLVDNASGQMSEAGKKVSDEIQNNPVRSSAIALGIGFVLGALFRR